MSKQLVGTFAKPEKKVRKRPERVYRLPPVGFTRWLMARTPPQYRERVYGHLLALMPMRRVYPWDAR
jgi:hypothetical protein